MSSNLVEEATQLKSVASHAAPSYPISPRSIVSVEHPCIIKNVDKCIETLGGLTKLQELLRKDKVDAVSSLYLRPQDRSSKPIPSTNVKTHNLLLHITVPKRSGRKRKRGSLEQHSGDVLDSDIRQLPSSLQCPSASRDTQYLLTSLRDNVGDFNVKSVGSIERTHRFRNMSDFVYSTTNSPFMQKMRESILPFEYEKLKSFKFDMSRGLTPNTDLIPPPLFVHSSIPFNYSYRQNPAVKQTVDSLGNITTVNTQLPQRLLGQILQYDDETIPSGPADGVPPIASLNPTLQHFINLIRNAFDERPIWTRRAISNRVASGEPKDFEKRAYPYVCYSFNSGPWRDSIIKFGVDPRVDLKYRIYQTLTFQIEASEGLKHLKQDRRLSHVFDGRSVATGAKTWQVCDISDPQLKSLLATKELRDECHTSKDGWYQNGTWGKVKIIMKSKIAQILAGNVPEDSLYQGIAAMPEIIEENTVFTAYNAKAELGLATSQEVHWASEIIAAARATTKRYYGEEVAGQATRNQDLATELEGRDAEIEDVNTDVRMATAVSQFGRMESAADDMQYVSEGADIEDLDSPSRKEFEEEYAEAGEGMSDEDNHDDDDDVDDGLADASGLDF